MLTQLLYGREGVAKTLDYVEFGVRKELKLHDTTKEANSTVGMAKSFHEIKQQQSYS